MPRHGKLGFHLAFVAYGHPAVFKHPRRKRLADLLGGQQLDYPNAFGEGGHAKTKHPPRAL